MALERLQKVLAAAGLGSRRSCEELILDARVTVDGECITELGTKVDAERQEIRCDGEVARSLKKLCFLVNKPRGVVCTNRDADARPRVVDLLPARDQRLFTVGRLDADTEGLLIVTNDGDFAQRVAHPRYGVAKTYVALVRGLVTDATKRELMTGVWLTGRRCRAVRVKIRRRHEKESLVEITMQEGRNREVRRMLAKTGHTVTLLRRVSIGPVEDDTLKPGAWRKLRPQEIAALLDHVASKRPGTINARKAARTRSGRAVSSQSARKRKR